jgi:glyoxylase-like metal-dependent hydrolase (beta-lactamase superfamily II)
VRRLADDLWHLRGFPPNAINVYLMGGVVVDAATRFAAPRILRQLEGQNVTAHALTHVHPDHQGASHRLCVALGVELWCGERDAEYMEDVRRIREMQHPHPLNRLIDRAWTGPSHPVARRLREGDEVGGFTVLDAPGHSPGHVAYWRETDRVLLLGDVLNGQNLLTGIPGLQEPPAVFTADPARNRESARRLAALSPELVCFGHGPPLRDADRFQRFIASLPAD